MIIRPSKEEYYLQIASTVSARSTCLRSAYGAVLVKDDKILSTGYNGSPHGYPNCIETENCKRKGVETRTRYELCWAVHAEQNAIFQCNTSTKGSVLYIAGWSRISGQPKLGFDSTPCMMCTRAMVQAGITGMWIYDVNHLPVCYSIKTIVKLVEDIKLYG